MSGIDFDGSTSSEDHTSLGESANCEDQAAHSPEDGPGVPVAELLERVRAGCDEAATELVRHYGPWLKRIVARRLHPEMRRHFDSSDFAQSAWLSIFAFGGDLHRFESSREFRAFAAKLAANKVGIETRRRLVGQAYTIRREHALSDVDVNVHRAPARRTATPSQEAVAGERWRQMVEDKPADYRGVLELRRQGCTFEEIAAALALSESHVRRLYQRALCRENRG